MNRFLAATIISCVMGITIITVVAVSTGHDSALVTGATSAIVGLGAGVTAYFKGRSTKKGV